MWHRIVTPIQGETLLVTGTTQHTLCPQASADGRLGRPHLSAAVNVVYTEALLSLPLGAYLGVTLRGHVVTLRLRF